MALLILAIFAVCGAAAAALLLQGMRRRNMHL